MYKFTDLNNRFEHLNIQDTILIMNLVFGQRTAVNWKRFFEQISQQYLGIWYQRIT